MNIHPSLLALSVLLPLLSGVLHADPAEAVEKDSEAWTLYFDPPYKVPTELPAGSALREELLALLRTKVTLEHKFSGSLRVYRNWACFTGSTVDENGEHLQTPPLDNSDAAALWLRTQEGRKLVQSSGRAITRASSDRRHTACPIS